MRSDSVGRREVVGLLVRQLQPLGATRAQLLENSFRLARLLPPADSRLGKCRLLKTTSFSLASPVQ